MARRAVTRTGKDRDGDITSLCNPQESWLRRSKQDSISDIESGTHTYYVPWKYSPHTEIRVVKGLRGKYLRTDRDATTKNNLDDLPDC